MPIKTCKQCGKEFSSKTKRRSYCAGECFRENERRGSRARLAKYTPERRKAHILIGCALASGKLTPQPCEQCGSWRYVEAHHDDYARPLEVRWLCKSHHRQYHVKHGPGLNAFCKEIPA